MCGVVNCLPLTGAQKFQRGGENSNDEDQGKN